MFNLGLPEDNPNIRIGWINGMATTYRRSRQLANHLSMLTKGHNIHGVYNSTCNPIADFGRCVAELLFKIPMDPGYLLHKQWDSFLKDAPAEVRCLQFCFSEGAIQVKNALKTYNQKLRQQIFVVAICPGGYIDPATCGDVLHYRARFYRDPVPYLDVLGMIKEAGKIVTLESHPSAAWFDHDFTSPTYKEYIRAHTENFLQNKGNSIW